jgi:type IV secretory pathway VirB10-like protein
MYARVRKVVVKIQCLARQK